MKKQENPTGSAAGELHPQENPPPEQQELESQEADLSALQNDLADAQDRVLRLHAELENYRKRVSREMADERRYAAMPIVRDLLPVVDNLERAIAAAEKSSEGGALLEGVKLVVQQFQSVLAGHGCKPIEALGKPFDPNYHEAILQQPSSDHAPGTVLMVAQPGYQLHDRVVRPAQVIVSG